MALPLPFVIVESEEIQANFDAIKTAFPLSRQHMKIEQPNVVGAAGQPAFANAWVNFDTTTYEGARFWKDPMGMVHVEGLVKSGTIGLTVFVLPAKYRPGKGHVFVNDTDTGSGRIDVAPTGNVVAMAGGNGYFSLNLSFRQEQ